MAKFMLDGQEYCGGGGSQIVELTQAEYDALPDTKKTDNILYAITDSDELSAENMACKDASGNLSNVQDELDNLNNIRTFTITDNNFANIITVYARGKEVTVFIDVLKNLVAKTSNLIYTLPLDLAPVIKTYWDTLSTDTNEFYRFTVSTDGSIRCYPYQTVNQQGNVAVSMKFTCK